MSQQGLPAESIEEAGFRVVESVLKASLFRVIQDRLLNDDHDNNFYLPPSGKSSSQYTNGSTSQRVPTLEIQAQLIVREVLLRACAQYLSDRQLRLCTHKDQARLGTLFTRASLSSQGICPGGFLNRPDLPNGYLESDFISPIDLGSWTLDGKAMRSNSVHSVEDASFTLYRRISQAGQAEIIKKLDENEIELLRAAGKELEIGRNFLLTSRTESGNEPTKKTISTGTSRDKSTSFSKPSIVCIQDSKTTLNPVKAPRNSTGNKRDSVTAELGQLSDMTSSNACDSEENAASACKFNPEPPTDSQWDEDDAWNRIHSIQLEDKSVNIDFPLILPYRSVVSHAGYYQDSEGKRTGLIVITGCHLPTKDAPNYRLILDNLLLYLTMILESMGPESVYSVIYNHGATSPIQTPSFHWIRLAYISINQKLKKNLTHFYVVHPTFWVKTTIILCKPLLSSKFKSKLVFVPSLNELAQLIPTQYMFIPDEIIQYDLNLPKNQSTCGTQNIWPRK